MSLRTSGPGWIPDSTRRIAQAALPQGSPAIRMRDALGELFHDEDFADLFPQRGRPALSPAVLALVSILQFAEGLSDRQAALAARARIDWKYALGLKLEDPGFDHSVLSEFRDRLVEGSAETRITDAVLAAASEAGLLKTRGRQRTDSTHVLSSVRGPKGARAMTIRRSGLRARSCLAGVPPVRLRCDRSRTLWAGRISPDRPVPRLLTPAGRGSSLQRGGGRRGNACPLDGRACYCWDCQQIGRPRQTADPHPAQEECCRIQTPWSRTRQLPARST